MSIELICCIHPVADHHQHQQKIMSTMKQWIRQTMHNSSYQTGCHLHYHAQLGLPPLQNLLQISPWSSCPMCRVLYHFDATWWQYASARDVWHALHLQCQLKDRRRFPALYSSQWYSVQLPISLLFLNSLKNTGLAVSMNGCTACINNHQKNKWTWMQISKFNHLNQLLSEHNTNTVNIWTKWLAEQNSLEVFFSRWSNFNLLKTPESRQCEV